MGALPYPVHFSQVAFQALGYKTAYVTHLWLAMDSQVPFVVCFGQERLRAMLTEELSFRQVCCLSVIVQPGLASELGMADAADILADVEVSRLNVVRQHVLKVVVLVAHLTLERPRVDVLHLDVLAEAVVGSEVLAAVLALVIVLQDLGIAVEL